MRTKGQYKAWVEVYEERLERAIAQKNRLQRSISRWKAKIEEMEDEGTGNKITSLANHVREYTSISLKKNSKNIKPGSPEWVARGLYYKYGIENGMSGNKLSSYTGYTKDMAYRMRRAFTQSFNSCPENKDTYYNFVHYIRNSDKKS